MSVSALPSFINQSSLLTYHRSLHLTPLRDQVNARSECTHRVTVVSALKISQNLKGLICRSCWMNDEGEIKSVAICVQTVCNVFVTTLRQLCHLTHFMNFFCTTNGQIDTLIFRQCHGVWGTCSNCCFCFNYGFFGTHRKEECNLGRQWNRFIEIKRNRKISIRIRNLWKETGTNKSRWRNYLTTFAQTKQKNSSLF